MEEEVNQCSLFQSLSNILSNLSHMTTMIKASKHRTSPEIKALHRMYSLHLAFALYYVPVDLHFRLPPFVVYLGPNLDFLWTSVTLCFLCHMTVRATLHPVLPGQVGYNTYHQINSTRLSLPNFRVHRVSACNFYGFKFRLLTSRDSHTCSFSHKNCHTFVLTCTLTPYNFQTKMNMDKKTRTD